MKVLRTPDGTWRAEQWPDGWRLYHLGTLLLTRATLDQAVTLMIELGGTPEHLRKD